VGDDAGRRSDVEFDGFDGTLLRGWWYAPEAAGAAPAIAMAHGFSAVKEMTLDRYAEVFCEAGFGVLVYDNRNLGASDGEPRQEIDPWAQVRDYRRAIGWLAARPDVDAGRIGIWGSSFSGGEVILVAACDERVRAVVANVPLVGLPGVDYSDTGARYAAIRDWVLSNTPLEGRPEEAVLGPVAVVEEDGVDLPVYLPQPESREWFLRFGRAPGSTWRNRVTLRNAFATDPPFDPGACVGHVAPTPLLMVVATDDRLAETEIALHAFERAGEPKQIEMVIGHHFTPYAGAGFEQASKAARDFFARYL
jgi:alpha-beta hydrolase superfamily lysophospholipase